MPLLYDWESFAEPILTNRFDNYFAPINLLWGAKISWSEKQCLVEYPRGDYSGISSYGGVNLLGIGGGAKSIPTTVLQATYTFKFKIVPETRLVEKRTTDLFWYGQGYEYAGGWGTTKMPLFRVWLSAEDNHLYLWFGGGRQQAWGTGGFKSTYPFGEWKVDLGEASKYEEYTDFTIWLNLEGKSFKKISVGAMDIPFPTGYTEITPADFYKSVMYDGIFIGDTAGLRTNLKAMIDEVEVYSEYFTPPTKGLCTSQKVGLGLCFVVAIGVPAGYGAVKGKR